APAPGGDPAPAPAPAPEPEPAPAPAPEPAPEPAPAPPEVIVDPQGAQDYARGALAGWGWGGDQFECLVLLWNRESGWRADAMNPSSGAYGIPQALPGEKMASAGPDWRTNGRTQVDWGLGYIADRYGSPCGAWQHSENTGWY
ncbi:aggregation-promoting factor C-terminal-like domain-containing protein, partial [Microbacterium resistens]